LEKDLFSYPKVAGGPALMISVYAIPKEGAPSLRFLQGWAAMLLVPFDFLCNCVIKPLEQAFPNPALRKVREGRGTHFVDDRRRDQRPGHPPLAGRGYCHNNKFRY
jgi:hypothetical protein